MNETAIAGPSARASDPITSHTAASSARSWCSEHWVAIHEALKSHGPMGKDSIARATGLTGVAVARRLPELKRMGMVKPTGNLVQSDTGRSEREWKAIK